MSWLDRATTHIAKLCDVLSGHELAGRGWTAESLLEAVQRGRVERGIRLVDVGEQRDPFGYFVWLLRASVDAGSPAPSLHQQAERQRRAERQAAEAAREAARRADILADAAAIDSVIAGMREKFPLERPGAGRASSGRRAR